MTTIEIKMSFDIEDAQKNEAFRQFLGDFRASTDLSPSENAPTLKTLKESQEAEVKQTAPEEKQASAPEPTHKPAKTAKKRRTKAEIEADEAAKAEEAEEAEEGQAAEEGQEGEKESMFARKNREKAEAKSEEDQAAKDAKAAKGGEPSEGITLDQIRALLSEKVGTHKAELKKKLTSLGGATGVTALQAEYYSDFYTFMQGLD
jgi:hypothetical protein